MDAFSTFTIQRVYLPFKIKLPPLEWFQNLNNGIFNDMYVKISNDN